MVAVLHWLSALDMAARVVVPSRRKIDETAEMVSLTPQRAISPREVILTANNPNQDENLKLQNENDTLRKLLGQQDVKYGDLQEKYTALEQEKAEQNQVQRKRGRRLRSRFKVFQKKHADLEGKDEEHHGDLERLRSKCSDLQKNGELEQKYSKQDEQQLELLGQLEGQEVVIKILQATVYEAQKGSDTLREALSLKAEKNKGLREQRDTYRRKFQRLRVEKDLDLMQHQARAAALNIKADMLSRGLKRKTQEMYEFQSNNEVCLVMIDRMNSTVTQLLQEGQRALLRPVGKLGSV